MTNAGQGKRAKAKRETLHDHGPRSAPDEWIDQRGGSSRTESHQTRADSSVPFVRKSRRLRLRPKNHPTEMRREPPGSPFLFRAPSRRAAVGQSRRTRSCPFARVCLRPTRSSTAKAIGGEKTTKATTSKFGFNTVRRNHRAPRRTSRMVASTSMSRLTSP